MNALFNSDVSGYGFYLVSIFDFSCIVLLYAISVELSIVDFKLIFNTKAP